MGNEIVRGTQYWYPEEYKTYNADHSKYIVFTRTYDSIASRISAEVIYTVGSVIPQTKTRVHQVVEHNKISMLSVYNPYRVVVIASRPNQKWQVEAEETFKDYQQALNFYIESKAKL